jgi:hypothetical protein
MMKTVILLFCSVAAVAAADGDVPQTPEVKPYAGHGPLSGFLK